MASEEHDGKLLGLHPDNPHYLIWRGSPTVLVTSAEHYGALLNLDFDFHTYHATLAKHRFNQTRVFSGVYCEDAESFSIEGNTLAPAPGRLVTPWEERTIDKRLVYDLDSWNDAYFARLHELMQSADEHGVVVEFVLFCVYYQDRMWLRSPFCAEKNLQGVGAGGRKTALSLDDEALTAIQDQFVEKICRELSGYDNLYYEICNESYINDLSTDDWNRHIAATIDRVETGLGRKHLVARNIANGQRRIVDPDEHVTIYNFHYATPPTTVALNYDLNRPIADDETGFHGSDDATYRIEAWDFLLAGGAIFSHLDYSYRVGAEDGSAQINAPGGGGAAYRRQLEVLVSFLNSFDVARMKPADDLINMVESDRASARVLADGNGSYAAYIKDGTRATLRLILPSGTYRSTWVDPVGGETVKQERVECRGFSCGFASPEYEADIALRIDRVG